MREKYIQISVPGQCWFRVRKGCPLSPPVLWLRRAPKSRVPGECLGLYLVKPLFCLTRTMLILLYFFFFLMTHQHWSVQETVNIAGLRLPSLEGPPLGPWHQRPQSLDCSLMSSWGTEKRLLIFQEPRVAIVVSGCCAGMACPQ